MISRREFFKQLFHPKTLKALSPVEDLAKLGQAVGALPERSDACEQAGLNLANFHPKRDAGKVPAAESRESDGCASGTGRNQTGE